MSSCSSCSHDIKKPLPKPWQNPKVITSVLSGVLLLLGYGFSKFDAPNLVSVSLYLGSLLSGGYYFGREGFEDLINEHEVGIELLMTVAAIAAFALGEWAEGAMLVFLYSISEAAEGYTGERARSAVRALMDLAPKFALVVRGNEEVKIPVEEVKIGDHFIVRPGESIPTDGIVISGKSSVNQAPVTGESIPVEKGEGDNVFSATLNGEGTLTVRATKDFRENTLSRIIELVERAQSSKGKSQSFIEKFGRRYSPAVLGFGIFIAAFFPIFFGGDWRVWAVRSVVFIVSAAPCALVISVPITLIAALGTAGRKGILVKGGVHMEALARIRVVAFDKTGTLTLGHPEVTDIIPIGTSTADTVLSIAAALELRSQHPLAEAVLERAKFQGLPILQPDHFQSLTGLGAKGIIDGEECFVGSPKLFEKFGLALGEASAQIERLQESGKTVILVGTQKHIHGMIAVADPPRKDAAFVVSELKKRGVSKVVMLTGDNERTARAVANKIGIEEIFANLSPEGKTEQIKKLEAQYGAVAMIGDGVNDAPALAAAHVGIAMGAAGTDVALETADVALMGDDLTKLPYLFDLSKRNWRTIQQNLALSTVVILILVVGAVGGFFTLPIAVLAHEISEFIVIGSGLRMLRG